MGNNLWIKEDYIVHQDNGRSYRMEGTPIYEAYTDSVGELFRSLMDEFGRCTGKMYVDSKNSQLQVGWVFEKRRCYEDEPSESYLAETWVTVWKVPPIRTPARRTGGEYAFGKEND